MIFFRQRRVAEAARMDARARANSEDERIVAELGPRPVFDPRANHLHARVVRQFNLGSEVGTAEGTLRVLQGERGNHSPSAPLAVAIGVLFCVEALGSSLIMRATPLPEAERTLFGIGLAAALFFFTVVVARGREQRPQGGEAETGRLKGLFLPIVYTLFALAMTIVRLREADEEQGQLQQYAEAAIMLACSVGPAFLSHHLIGMYMPLRRLNREIALEEERLRKLEGQRRWAERYLTRVSERQLAWDEAAERLRALYRTEQRLELAEPVAPLTTAHQGDDDEEA